MGKSKDLATGETRFVNTAGDTMTGDLGIGVAPAQPLHVFKAGSQGGGLAPLIKVQNDTNNLTGDGSAIEFHGKYQGGEWGFGKIGGANSGSNFGGALEFHTNTGTGSVSTGFTKKMTIDRSGHVTMPNQPAFWAFSSTYLPNYEFTSYNISGAGKFNTGNHLNLSSGVFTAPVAGRYQFNAAFHSSSVSTTQRRIGRFVLNSTSIGEFAESSAKYADIGTSVIVSMSANDIMQLYTHAVGHFTSVDFSGHLIG
tara:strand:- start:221 stop:982 length:762 start_codon:yes stop_codon:yes gene_type:complete